MSQSTRSPRRFRAIRSFAAVAAIIGAALVAPQMASANGAPQLPTTATVVVETDPGIAAQLGDVPEGSLPAVLAAEGDAVQVTVSLKDSDGNAAFFPYGATVTVTADGPGELTAPALIVMSEFQSSVTFSASYSKAAAAVTISAVVTPEPAPEVDPGDPLTVILPVDATSAPFTVNKFLTLIPGDSGQLLDGTAGADGEGCQVVDPQHPMCGTITLPNAAAGGTALTLGLCPTGQECREGALVTQFLGDISATRTAPATMTIFCDKTLCGKGGVAKYRALWSTSANGAFESAPPCPAKGVIGDDQDFCTDFRASTRMNAGDLKLVVLFLTDVRGMI